MAETNRSWTERAAFWLTGVFGTPVLVGLTLILIAEAANMATIALAPTYYVARYPDGRYHGEHALADAQMYGRGLLIRQVAVVGFCATGIATVVSFLLRPG